MNISAQIMILFRVGAFQFSRQYPNICGPGQQKRATRQKIYLGCPEGVRRTRSLQVVSLLSWLHMSISGSMHRS